jgi:hypothetical protein
VSHLANHDVPQQAIHRESLLWRVVRDHNPFQLVVGQRGEVSEGALLYKPPVLQQRFEKEIPSFSSLGSSKWLFIFCAAMFSTACVENFSRFLPKMSCSSGGAADFSSANAWSCETQWIEFWLFGACGNVVYAV